MGRLNKKVKVHDLGLIDYKKAWDYQAELFQRAVDRKIYLREHPEIEESTENYLVLCSHPHVYTLGKSGEEKNLLLSTDDLALKKIEYYKINRGGDITYHGPGQVVGYPILDLDNFFTDVHKYLRFLEEAIIRTLADYGLQGHRMDGLTGVWLDPQGSPRKICALGVKMSRWVTMHGFAFNVNVDLDYFKYIIPCGIEDKAVTSLQKELNQELDLSSVQQKVLHHLSEIFEMRLMYGK